MKLTSATGASLALSSLDTFTRLTFYAFRILTLRSMAIFGGGFLLSEAAAAKKSKAEEAALEVMSARLAAISESQQNSRMSADGKIIWPLSDREKALVKSLGKHGSTV